MKRISIFIIICILGVSQIGLGESPVIKHNADWKAFSKNLVTALKADNQGLQLSAMQQIIKHGSKLNVDDAVFEVMSFYRDHKDIRVRQMALNTLYKMENKWAMDFLRRAIKFEDSPILQKQIYFILRDYDHKKLIAKG